MENFLKELGEILTLNNYSDVDETIEYFKELILDSIENGQSEEEVIEALGSAKEVAYTVLGDKKIRIDETTSDVVSIETISADINIDAYDGDKINVECNNSKFEVRNDNGSIYIKEIKKVFAISINKSSNNIYIHIPKNYKLNKMLLIGVSSDIDIKGDFFIDELKVKTVSGDIEINKLDCNIVSINTVSGDVEINDTKINDANVSTVSGDATSETIKCISFNGKAVSGDVDFKGSVDRLNLNTKSGDINVSIDGLEEDYHIECKDMADKKIADKSLTLNSVTGDIDYSFKG